MPASTSSTPAATRSAAAAVLLLLLLLAFGFQGSRGIWDPDEGFYSNITLGMLGSGDWLIPRLNGEPFLDKPPLVYWSTAAGMAVVGRNEWGARSGQALWFAGSALLVGWLGGRWWGAHTGRIAALVYATMLLPCLAANVLTPDTPLAFASVLSFGLFWRLEETPTNVGRTLWGAAAGAALGLGALAKGPAILVLAAPLGLFLLIRRRSRSVVADPGVWAMAVAFLAVALPWFLFVGARLPGALAYMLDNQISGRLVDAHYARNSGLLGGLLVYVPTLIVGSLPWCLVWVRRTKSTSTPGAAPPFWRALRDRPASLLLVLWIAVPTLVFLVARSRLPLYILPVFAPLALVTARRLTEPGRLLAPPLGRRSFLSLALCVLGLLAGKAFGATWASDQDARAVAAELRAAGIALDQRIVTLDVKLNGLAFYGYSRLEQATEAEVPYPFYVPAARFPDLRARMIEDRERRVILVERRKTAHLLQAIEGQGLHHLPPRELDDRLALVEVGGESSRGVEPERKRDGVR